jgi:hypothetical protein
MVTPVENIMSDEDAEALANSLLKDEKGCSMKSIIFLYLPVKNIGQMQKG